MTPAGPTGQAQRHGAGAATPTRQAVLGPYLGYIGYFVGAGLISGGIVHYPLDPSRYTKIAAAGVVVFVAATVLNEIILLRARVTAKRAARLVLASLALSLGIGMLSGGIQHFSDFPQRAATLIPAGMVLSFLAFVARNAHRPFARSATVFAILMLGLASLVYVSLQPLAERLSEAGSTHSHSESGSAGAVEDDVQHESSVHTETSEHQPATDLDNTPHVTTQEPAAAVTPHAPAADHHDAVPHDH